MALAASTLNTEPLANPLVSERAPSQSRSRGQPAPGASDWWFDRQTNWALLSWGRTCRFPHSPALLRRRHPWGYLGLFTVLVCSRTARRWCSANSAKWSLGTPRSMCAATSRCRPSLFAVHPLFHLLSQPHCLWHGMRLTRGASLRMVEHAGASSVDLLTDRHEVFGSGRGGEWREWLGWCVLFQAARPRRIHAYHTPASCLLRHGCLLVLSLCVRSVRLPRLVGAACGCSAYVPVQCSECKASLGWQFLETPRDMRVMTCAPSSYTARRALLLLHL